MSRLSRRLAPLATAALTSPRTRALRRGIAEWRRRLRGEPHRVHYFHQVDDPYSQLAAQVLERFAARYEIELVPHLVGPPPDAAAPERARLEAFARKDAADVAPALDLAFPRRAAPPLAEDVRRAAQVLAAAIAGGSFASAAAPVGAALWQADRAALEGLAAGIAAVDEATARAAVATGNAERRRLGHYLGATFYYGGEWYWGVDRLHHLERRLAPLGARRPDAAPGPLVPRPGPQGPRPGPQGPRPGPQGPQPGPQGRQPGPQGRQLEPAREAAPAATGRVVLEFYLSLRSPYTYIAFERTFDLARRLPVDLVLRPVLPMVMRGLPVPREKQLYIVLDTRREAEDAGVPFGRICDPVGRPVERCFSLFPWARQQGRAAQLLLAFGRAAFAEGVDTVTDAGMRYVVERAGLSWAEARAHLDRDTSWWDELEANRGALLAAGLWGVPSYRLPGRAGEPDFSTWGQDRLWLVEQEIRRRLAAGGTR